MRVLDDRIGAGGEQSLVEIDTPIRMVGRIARSALIVFAREDLEVVPGRVWWLANRALRIEQARGAAALVTWGEPPGRESPFAVVTVPCSRLSGVPVGALMTEACTGATPALELTPGTPHVSFRWRPRVTIDSLGGAGGGNVGYDVFDARLLDQQGDRAFVEARDRTHGVRFRAWLPATGMRWGPSSIGKGGCGSCCPGELKRERGYAAGRVLAPAALGRTPRARPFATIPAGTFLRWHELQGDRVRVSWFWPRADLDDYTLVVEGWIDRRTLPDKLEPRVIEQVHGRVVLASGPRVSAPVTVTGRSIEQLALKEAWSITADAEGRFILAVDATELMLQAHTADGLLASTFVPAEAWPGGTDEYLLELVPAVRVQGCVVDEAGRAAPSAEVSISVEMPWLILDLPLQATDREGRFALSLPPGDHHLRVDDWERNRSGVVTLARPQALDSPLRVLLRIAPGEVMHSPLFP